jgi:hypothetical protein
MMKRRLPGAALLTILAVAALVTASPTAAIGIRDAVIIGTNSVDIEKDASVDSGDVVANDRAPGDPPVTLDDGVELSLDIGSSVAGALYGNEIHIELGSAGASEAFCLDITDLNGVLTCQSTALPIFASLPTFEAQPPAGGSPDFIVGNGGSEAFPPGDYDVVDIGRNATATVSGGEYNIGSFKAGRGSKVLFSAPSTLRIEGRLDIGANATFGPGYGSGIAASDIMIHVAGINGIDGGILEAPLAVTIGGVQGGNAVATFQANVYAPYGTIQIKVGTDATGAFIAKDVEVEKEATVNLDSGFNLAPVADDQTVITDGVNPIDITLTGSDADGDALTFSIASHPTAGSITAGPTQVTPTSATVTYTADVEGAFDSFVFMVDDGNGGTDVALVEINPSDDPPPPGPDVVVAKTDTVEVIKNSQDNVITLAGASPDGVVLTHFLVAGSGPLNGTLGSIVQVDNHDAEVTYTPNADFACAPLEDSCDSFQFEVRGDVNGDGDTSDPGETDTATMSINIADTVDAAPPVALDQSVTASVGGSVTINLVSPANTSEDPEGRTCSQNSDCADGFICDDGSCVPGQ